MGFKDLAPSIGDYIQWDEAGQQLTGKLLKMTERKARYGTLEVLHFETAKQGGGVEVVEVAVSAGLQSFEWTPGREYRVTYEGEQKNPRTGRTFSAFRVEVGD